MITAEVHLHSSNSKGQEVVSFILQYHRYVHAELMTHRVFSRNAASSRAIPVQKMIQRVEEHPAIPLHWGANQKGMQARKEIEKPEEAQKQWLIARDQMVKRVHQLNALGLHKQVANRLLEPFQYIQVLVTTTELENWFALRAHPDAQPEIQELAYKMQLAYLASEPRRLDKGQYHLPFIGPEDYITALWVVDYILSVTGNKHLAVPKDYLDLVLLLVSAARAARISYGLNERALKEDQTQESALIEDLVLAWRLARARPIHASPFEHQCTPYTAGRFQRAWLTLLGKETGERNFRGFKQFRSVLEAMIREEPKHPVFQFLEHELTKPKLQTA